MDEGSIQDFPIRGRKVNLCIKRRRWEVKETKAIITRDWKEAIKTQFVMSGVPTDVTLQPLPDGTFACTLNRGDFLTAVNLKVQITRPMLR